MSDLRIEKIERLERKLLKANRISRKELQEIVSAPQFLDGVNARIRAAEPLRRAAAETSGGRRLLPLWSRQKIGPAFGAFAVLAAAAVVGLIVFTEEGPPVSRLSERVEPPEIQTRIARAGNPEPPVDRAPKTSGNAENPIGKNRNLPSRVAFKSKSAGPPPASRSKRRTPRPGDQGGGAFYPLLAFAEDLEETEEGGQIIRVELSRSSLLALGLQPPMDDETVKIKTDLLIGSDGVARGIRFVKNED